MTASFKQDPMKSLMYIIWRFNTADVQMNVLKSSHIMDTAWDDSVSYKENKVMNVLRNWLPAKCHSKYHVISLCIYSVYMHVYIYVYKYA